MGALGGQRKEGPVPSKEKTVGTRAAEKSGSWVGRKRKGVSSRVFKSKDIFFLLFILISSYQRGWSTADTQFVFVE